jgi:hypothetical protein
MQTICSRTTKETALEAIENRRYKAVLRQQSCTNIMKVAVTFDWKRIFAKSALSPVSHHNHTTVFTKLLL